MATTHNIQADKIRIVPSARGKVLSNDYGSDFVTEHNLAEVTSQLMDPDTDGFVITEEISSTADEFEFSLCGYSIKATVGDILTAARGGTSGSGNESFVSFAETGGVVYAYLKLNESSDDQAYTVLDGADGAGATSTDSGTTQLALFSESGGEYEVCRESSFKLRSVSDHIDKLFSNKISEASSYHGVEFYFDDNNEVITGMVVDDGEVSDEG